VPIKENMDSKRQLQLGEVIKRSFAPILLKEGIYIYGDAMVSVTNVKVTPDLGQAKIYLSIYNTNDKDMVLKKISNHTHVLKQSLAATIKNQVRRIPQIYFYFDETLDEMYKIDEMFKSLKGKYITNLKEEEE